MSSKYVGSRGVSGSGLNAQEFVNTADQFPVQPCAWLWFGFTDEWESDKMCAAPARRERK